MKLIALIFAALITIVSALTLLVISTMLCVHAKADDYHLLDLNELGINYRNYTMVNDKARNLLIFPENPKEGIDVLLNFDLFKYGFWDNQIQSVTTGAQYRGIGLETRLGIRVTDYVQLGYWHHSQHVLDRAQDHKFASEDALELRIYIYRSKNNRAGIF